MLLVALSNACLQQGVTALVDPGGSRYVSDLGCETGVPCSNVGGEGGLLALTFAGVMLGVTSLLALDRSWLKPQ